MSIRIADLHESYGSASQEDRIAMANLGAVCWGAVKDALYGQWQTALTAEESEKAEKWREEGRKELGQLLKAKGSEVAALSAQLAAAEAAVEGLRGSIAAEAAKHAEALVEAARKDFELVKSNEMGIIMAKLSAAEAKEGMYAMIKEAHESMKIRMETAEKEKKELSDKLTKSITKSSHAIGKAGEATVREMLETTVMTTFPYSSFKYVCSVDHAADFHLWIMTPTGEKVKILIDSKKYKNSVNSGEIRKLHRDVDEDDDAHAGMMISLETSIHTAKIFTILRTEKKKPVLYLSFNDIDVEMRRDILCWGIRVLQSIGKEQNTDEKDKMIEGIETFLKEMDKSISDISKVITQNNKTTLALKQTRANIIARITAYRAGNIEKVELTSGDIEEDDDSSEDGCNAVIKKTGSICGKKLIEGGDKCAYHSRGPKK